MAVRCTPSMPLSGGLTEVTMMLRLPIFLMASSDCRLAPSPTASMATTLPTPKTMPSIVRRERRLWRQTSDAPIRTSIASSALRI